MNFLDKSKDHTLLGQGTPIDKQRGRISNIWWPDEHRKSHLFCFGATSMGKSRLIENIIEQDIKKGFNIALVDPKGDIELLEKIVQTAFGCERENDLILINPIFPECSAKLDPLAFSYSPEERVNHIISCIDASQEHQYFIQVAHETTLAIVMSLMLFQKHFPQDSVHINISEIKKRCGHSDLDRLRRDLDKLPSTEEVEDIKAAIDKIIESPPDFFSKVSSSLRTVLTSLTLGSVGEIMGKAKTNRFISRLEAGKGVILIIQTGSMLTRKTSHLVGRIIISMIQSFVGRKYARGDKITPPLALFIDEFGQFAYRDISALFAQAGSAGVWIHAFTQSIADLADSVGEDSARRLLDNTNNKIYMRVNDNATAEYIETYSGKIDAYDAVLSLGGNMMIRSVEKPSVRQNDILTLPKRTFFFFGIKNKMKGRPNKTSPSLLKINFPKVEMPVS